MNALENKILELIRQGCTISYIEKNLDIKEEDLADIIIELDEKGFIKLQDKNWVLTDQGKEIFMKREEDFKKLKIDYLRGEINRDEFDKRKKELSDTNILEKSDSDSRKFFYPPQNKDISIVQDRLPKEEPKIEEDKDSIIINDILPKEEHKIDDNISREKIKVEEDKVKEEPVELKKINCPKCKTENRPESNFCRKCGISLKKL